MGSNQSLESITEYGYEISDSNNNETDWSNLNFLKMNFSDDNPIWNRRPDWEVAVKSIAILPIMAIGLLGNLSIICLILSLKSLRKSHINLFIMNMALADLLTTM